ncbi:hypothetical protein VCSRO70_3446 [Vibrio cholerae]|uniref:hypothetical protein n=1 Tax=Vibrio cholerae TaxID=666 RepID=UPI0011D84F40|nr:hypothetical protein [Vibrio cholerae]EHS7465981.1 hypothetical protein [Vibrio cholerae]EJL6293273.1 hypothetical protein [Vibrio cholerae]ELE1940752.1 hypothetical protein [Vibrio cholerae]TXZ64276.1 hypothetical protein FXE41_10770 [Vibrio cholerae]GHY52651.1 hypothetical protein VCSRO70_3446 [Vibrio cholerae]
MELVVQRIFKRILLILAGSGMLTNALYVYGLGYYQGYVKAFGFEYAFFAIDWASAIIWTYYASRELGMNLIVLMGAYPYALFVIFPMVYLFARVWSSLAVETTTSEIKSPSGHILKNYRAKACYVGFRRNNPKLYAFTLRPLEWLFAKEQAFFAFLASYFFLFILCLLPSFMSIWVFLPSIGSQHGQFVVSEYLDRKNGNLCEKDKNGWNPCISIKTKHIKAYDPMIEKNEVTGLVILKNGTYIGLYTEDGAITMTLPVDFYYKNVR